MDEPPQKRFKYTSYNQQINSISIDVGKNKGVSWEKEEFDDSEQTKTPFTSEVARLSLLDLTLPFQELQKTLYPLTTSLPIILLNIEPISAALYDLYSNVKDGQDNLHSGLDSTLQLHHALFETCQGEALPYLSETAKHMVRLGSLRALDPKLVERTFSSLSLILRTMAPFMLKSSMEAQKALKETWSEVRPYLRPKSNKKYVRKCIADAWAGVIRKARSDGLSRLVDVLLEDEAEGLEAVWTNSLKGTSHNLHSRALPVISLLLDRLAATSSEAQLTTLNLVMTALVHHCSSSTIVPVVEAILARIEPAAPSGPSSSKNPVSLSSSNVMLSVLSTVLLVRKGKRYPEPLLKPTMVKLQNMLPILKSVKNSEKEADVVWRRNFVLCVMGSLQAGKLSHWLSPGVALIDGLWAILDVRESFAFVNSLVGMKWQGVEQFILPHVARTAVPHLSTEPLATLNLLNQLAEAGYLSGGLSNVQGGRWRQSLLTALRDLLANFAGATDSELDRKVLIQLLHLISIVRGDASQLAPHISILIKRFGSFAEGDAYAAIAEGQGAGVWNDAHMLASLLRCAESYLGDKEMESEISDILVGQGGFSATVRKWNWNAEVMSVLASILTRTGLRVELSTADHDFLTKHLLSANSSLRKAILEVLSANVPIDTTAQKVWNACLLVEASGMTLKNVRERTSNIGKLGRLLESIGATEEEELVEDATRYLVSQLKVNFRPLYPDTVAALAGLGSSRGESLWGILWDQLLKTISAETTHVVDLDWKEPDWTHDTGLGMVQRDDEVDEEDAEFRCPNLIKGRRALSSAWTASTDHNAMDLSHEIEAQISPDRLDVLNYEAQLLAVLASAHSLAEKHSRLLVPVFLSMAQRDPAQDQANPALAHFSTRQLQNRTTAFLELFTHFVNPKAFYRADEVYTLYLDIVSRGEVKLQSLAVKCLMTYKSPKLLPYGDSLQALLEDSKFRDELVNLNLSAESEAIDPQHRDEFMPVAIRLLYGILISKRGRSSSQGLGARKQAILTALSGCHEDEYKTLVDLMLEPFTVAGSEQVNVNVPGRQQSGYLTLLHDVTRYLGPQTVAYWPRLLRTVIALVDNAQSQLGKADAPVEVAGEDIEIDNEDEQNVDADVEAEKGAAPLRSIRTAGIKRIVQFVRAPTSFDFRPYLHGIYDSIISPRLDKLEIENTQAPSGTLDLIAAFAASPTLAPSLVDEDERTLVKTFACLTAVKVKPAVIARVFDVVEHLLADADDEESQKTLTIRVLVPKVRALLDNIIKLVPILSAQSDDELLKRLLGILSRLAAIITDGQQAQQLASLLGPMLKLPGKKLPERGKTNVLVTLQKLYAVSPDFQDPSSTFFSQTYNLISNLFQSVYLPPTRKALVQVHQTFGSVDTSLQEVIRLSTEINAYSERRKEEPDFDRRLSAFAEINDVPLESLPKTPREWLPLLRNGLFYLLEQEELSIRTNASNLLQRFITLVGEQSEGPMVDMLLQVIMPGLRKTFKHKAELVRNEALLVLAHAVKTCTGVPVLVEMQPLLGGDDEELNFFTNVSHIQVHRRARALRRLRDVLADPECEIREQTTSTVFMPVLEHIISGSTDITDHHLVNEAITTTGSLTGHLVWSRYNATVMRFLKLGSVKTNQQRFYIRTVSAILDHFKFDLKAKVVDMDEAEVAEEDDDAAIEVEEAIDTQLEGAVMTKTGDNRFSTALITDVIIHRLLPALSKFAESKDETEDNIRVPISLGIVKLAHALPGEHSTHEITRIVTSVSNVLKSKDQDTRDIARDTICKIALFLGPDWLVRVLKELRTALFRGPQKHVLAVTVHAILVQATSEPDNRFSNLDDAVEDSVQISAEVVWGESGKDVVAEGFKTKMREVRGANSRGLDTFQLIARLVSPSKLSVMLAPVREVMHASQAIKTMLQVDEALRRISLGLNANNRLGPEDVLSLCFSLISGNSSYIQPKRKVPKTATAADSYRVQMKRKDAQEEDFYPLNAYRFIAFGLDLFVTAFKRGRFDFDNLDILSRLGPLVPVVGNTLYSSTSGVLLLGLKATAAIVRCPVGQVEESVPVFINNIFRVIKNAGGTAESDVAQTALKTLAVILRDNKTSNITDKQLRYLLEVISPDIEETDRQSAIFTILRSIVGRKFVVPEIYDLMDRVSAIMVTNQSTHVQELCRGVLMAFLLDYPQGAGRLKAQMTFLARNLSYQFESGRISVLEVLSAVLTKFSDELVHEYADMLFVSLVAVLANDDSEKCRAMAGLLIKALFGRLGDQQKTKTLQVLQSWVETRDEQASLASASLGVYAIIIESAPESIEEIINVVTPAVNESAQLLQSAETSDDDTIHLEHTVALNALKALVRTLEVSPSHSTAENLPWESIVQHLLFPHTGVRLAAARSISILLASTPAHEKEGQGHTGIQILGEETLLDVARKSCLLMKGDETDQGRSEVVDPKLADVLVKILWQISKHWAASHTTVVNEDAEDVVEEEDEDEEPAFVKAQNTTKPLAWLMSRMSFLARHLIVHRPSANSNLFTVNPWTQPLMAILRFFAGVMERLDTEQARGFLVHVLNPIHRITDESGDLAQAQGSGIDDLRQLALEVRDFVQTKVGVTDFSRVWENLRRHTTERREGRRQAKNQLATRDPKAYAERQGKRMTMKKDSKKRKVKAFADGKIRERPTKRRT